MIRDLFLQTRDVIVRIDLPYVVGPVVGVVTDAVMNHYPSTGSFALPFAVAAGAVTWGAGVICRGEHDAYQKRRQRVNARAL